jgi:4a-hydroxytetrahydrobiopterin dehydratase
MPKPGNSFPLSTAECSALLLQLPDWQLLTVDGIARLHKGYRFRSFRQALAFTNSVGALAEEVGHHPQLITEWGQVQVSWWTHDLGGLQPLDFELAARTDLLCTAS